MNSLPIVCLRFIWLIMVINPGIGLVFLREFLYICIDFVV